MAFKTIGRVLTMLFISAGSVNAQVTNQNLFDTIPFMVDHYRERIALFKQEPVVKGQIIFLGNSITEMGNWKALTGIPTVVNRGIGGDITFGVLLRLDDIIQRQPAKLFILIGINDIGKDIPDEKIADNCRKIIERVKRESRGTTIFLQSILPVNPGVKRFPQHYDKEDHVLHTNHLLRKVAEAANVRFINLYPLFLDQQQRLDESLTTDGLHLNQKAYKIWVDFLKETDCL
jgi:lysophospholipase L1-like esterase